MLCERCLIMKRTRDKPNDANCNCEVCLKQLCEECYNDTHKFRCYYCQAPNSCYVYFGNGRKKVLCNDCR